MSLIATFVAASSVSEYQPHVGFEWRDPRGIGAVLAVQNLRISCPMRSQLRPTGSCVRCKSPSTRQMTLSNPTRLHRLSRSRGLRRQDHRWPSCVLIAARPSRPCKSWSGVSFVARPSMSPTSAGTISSGLVHRQCGPMWSLRSLQKRRLTGEAALSAP